MCRLSAPRDIGLDRAMIGAYGHDDRVDAYPALMAEIGAMNPAHTTVCIQTDKEEGRLRRRDRYEQRVWLCLPARALRDGRRGPRHGPLPLRSASPLM